jgi:hypothetical protein
LRAPVEAPRTALRWRGQNTDRQYPGWLPVVGLALAITLLALLAAIGIAYELCPPLTGTRASGALYAPLSDLWAMSVDEWGRPISILVRIERFRGLLETFGIGQQWQHRALFVGAAGIGVFLIGVATLRFVGSRFGLLWATLALVICALIPAATGALVGFQLITRDIVSDRATLQNLREDHCASGERCGEHW